MNSTENQTGFGKIQKLHLELLKKYNQCYLQITYSRGASWKVSLIALSIPMNPEPISILGTGITAEEACQNALENYKNQRTENPCARFSRSMIKHYGYDLGKQL